MMIIQINVGMVLIPCFGGGENGDVFAMREGDDEDLAGGG